MVDRKQAHLAAYGGVPVPLGVAPQAQAATFVKGADISWLPQMQTRGHGLVRRRLTVWSGR